jgi:hypothetical protein
VLKKSFMKILSLTSKIFTYTFIIANLLFANVLFGQTVGDYRSNVNPTGDWTSASSWQVCTSTYPSITWGPATNYPGQIAGAYAVLIQAVDVINIGTSGITTQAMGTITINGLLILTGDSTNGGIDYFFNSQMMIVTSGLNPSANIKFINKVNLKFPENASLQVSSSGLTGDCSAQQSIYIGSLEYAVCKGNTADTGLTFGEVMGLGGTGTATSNSPVCVGNSINLSAIPPPNGTFTYSWSGPTGVVFSTSQNPTLIATATNQGIYSVKMTRTSDGKYSISQTTVVVNSSIIAPTMLAPTAICYGFTANWTASASATSYELDVSTSNTFTTFVAGYNNLSVGNVTSYKITGLILGTTYYYRVRAKNSCGATSSSSLIGTYNLTGTYSTKEWDNGWLTSKPSPSGTDLIVFKGTGTFNSIEDLTGCSCQVKDYVTVNINSGHTLTLTNKLTVESTASMYFYNNASLVQINNVANSGDIDYQRITAARKTDYTYWSSPVTPMTLGDLYYPYTLNGTFYSYEATAAGEDWSPFDAETEMVAGKGYIANQGAEVPSGIPLPPGLLSFTFVGVPNNGNLPISPIYANKSYLLGNPYPSAINADMFLADNSAVLNGTLYFWTHKTEIQNATNITDGTAGSGAFAYTSNDYATYNITGGVGVDSGTITGSAPSGGAKPNGFISAGQGFFASTKVTLTGTSILFNNTMRVAGGTTLPGGTKVNEQFFKTKNPNKSSKPIQKNRIWLNLTNTQGAFKQTLIGYVTDATNDFDSRFDGESFDGNEFVDFYSVNQDKNLVIQGRALPFDENDEIQLGFRTTINGAFTIKIDEVDGLLTNQAVFIEDKLTNIVFDLKSGNYTFNTVAGTFNDRFVLRYTDNSSSKTLETANFDSLEKTVLVSSRNKQIKIDSSVESIDKVAIFDLLGRQIYQKDKVDNNELSIALTSIRQTLVVKVMLQNGKAISKKIIF